MTDKWEEMMFQQDEFQAMVGMNRDPVPETKELILHIVSECDELLREIAWKTKRRQSITPNRNNILTQIVDIQKLVMAIACSWGFDAEEFYDCFMDKSRVVEQLYKQEYPLYEIIASGAPVVAVDIDGVLADYPRCFEEWCDVDLEELTPVEVAQLKDAYRQSGAKRNLPVVDDAVEFTQLLREWGYKIVLVSARPAQKYARIFSDTLYWLDHNGFAYDAILWDSRKETRLVNEFEDGNLVAFVDDDPRNVERVSASGIRSFEFGRVNFVEILRELQHGT